MAGVPQADTIVIGFCNDPKCGPHIVLQTKQKSPIAQAILSKEQALHLIKGLQNWLYEKAASHD